MSIDYQDGINKEPLVSIVCLSYNHEPFIRRCIEGFLMQKTSFPFEILIHDDASTDKSAEIIREYEAKYPALFKPIYQTENQCSRGVHVWATIMFPRAKGKYIALCEGDDYWTDPMKLQKQVDYMELHPECSLCIHNAIQHWEDKSFPDSPFSHLEERDYSGEELTEKWIMPTASMLFRTFCSHQYDTLMKQAKHILTFWDTPLAVTCSQLGLVHALQDTMSVYRRSSGSFTLQHSAGKHYRTGLSWMEFLRIFGKSYRPYAIDQAVYNFIMGCSCSVKERNVRLFMYSFYNGFLCHPIAFLRKMLQLFKEKNSH